MRVLQDPNRVNLRKAARAAIVVPGVFACFVATGNEPSALFAALGSFSALVFSDFGGPLPRRFRAYVLLAVLGALLDALGTSLADTVWPAVVVTLVVAFAISLSGALGGYFAAASTSATLAFVLAVMTPGVEADLWARQVGWLVGVLVAGAAAVLLWPVHQRDRVRLAAARVLREAAGALDQHPSARHLGALHDADAELATRSGVVYRPAGSMTRERALVAVVVATRRMPALLDAITSADCSPSADRTPEYRVLTRRVARSLAASAAALEESRSTADGPADFAEARTAHSDALEAWAVGAMHADGASVVVDRFTATFPLRRISLAALHVHDGVNDAARDRVRSTAAGKAALARVRELLRAHCRPRSVRFRNAARAGLGLALAVLVAKSASIDHAFWVVLGALSVLRSSALGTGATALQALVGALVGFGLATVVMLTLGGDEKLLWILLPIVVLLAGYTPGAVNYVVGQAAFTVFVVVLFNVLVPDGWRVGLVRVQDVAIGAGISVIVGALLWPRGARGVARRAFAELLRAGAARVEAAMEHVLRRASADPAVTSVAVADARARAVAALEDLALEHGGGHVERAEWSSLLVEALLLDLAADGISRSLPSGMPATICPDARAALGAESSAVLRSVDAAADQLVRSGVRSLADREPVTFGAPAALGRCLEAHVDRSLHDALALLWIHEWLLLAGEHEIVGA